MSPKDRLDAALDGCIPVWAAYIAFNRNLLLLTSERTALLDYIKQRPELRAAAKAAGAVDAMPAFLAALDWEPPYTDPDEWIPQRVDWPEADRRKLYLGDGTYWGAYIYGPGWTLADRAAVITMISRSDDIGLHDALRAAIAVGQGAVDAFLDAIDAPFCAPTTRRYKGQRRLQRDGSTRYGDPTEAS